MDDDYSAYEERPTDEAFAELDALVKRMKEAALDVAHAEASLKRAKERHRELAEKLLPEKMASMGLEDFTHESGLKIRLREVVGVSLPKKEIDRYQRGLAWLEENGHGKSIKRKLIAQFKKGQTDAAEKLAQELQSQGYPVKTDKEVHPSTLKSLIKELLEGGEDVPKEIFGVHHAKIAEVKK